MFAMKQLRTLGLASAIAIGGAFAAQAADMSMPKTVNPVPGNASTTEMKSSLQKLGFTEIDKVTHSGNVYTAEAKWHGEWTTLRIDAETGSIEDTSDDPKVIAAKESMTEEYVREELERVGFTNVGNIEFTGNVITATALTYGQQTAVRIDKETGVVSYNHPHNKRAGNAIATPKTNLSAADLRTQLAPLGYADVRNVEAKGNVYTLDGYKNGQWVALRIDAQDGGVMEVK